MDEVDMENTRDWLSRLLEMMPVKGTRMGCAGINSSQEHADLIVVLRRRTPAHDGA
jgi:cytochrome c2